MPVDESDDDMLVTGAENTVRDFVEIAYLRPMEVDALIGDSGKAPHKLGWTPAIDGRGLAKLMVESDTVLDVSKSDQAGWLSKIDLDQGIERTVSRYRENVRSIRE